MAKAVKMGFEADRRIVKVFNNRRVTATIGGQTCNYRSVLEYRWALYLQFLVDSGELDSWEYETDTFYFPGETTAPVRYLPDFKIVEPGGVIVYQECKGWHDGPTNTKLRRTARHYPDVVMELVLQRIPKKGVKGVNRRRVADKYTRRIIDASDIFKQMKGAINFDTPNY